MYPNPATGNITITQSVMEDGAVAVSIVNFLGQLIYSNAIIFAGSMAEINIANAPTGMYFVEIKDSKGVMQNFKLVIEK